MHCNNKWIFAAVLGLFTLINACRASRLGIATNLASGSILVPVMTGRANPATSKENGRFLVSESGKTRVRLVVGLDYFPMQSTRGRVLPGCLAALPADLDIGLARCLEGSTDVRPLLAADVDQDCYTNPRFARITASRPFIFSGCRKAAVYTHLFRPTLRIDVEIQE